MSDSRRIEECIQPIKGGRNPSALLAAPDFQKDDILGKQSNFEKQLRTYSGDDPLGLWWSYIKWVQQSFPSGGKRGNLVQILHRCLVAVGNIKKYENDPRLCEIWIQFANSATEPLEVYNYMHSNNICSSNAQFYTSWAWKLEQIGNISAANKVLVRGLNCKAQPAENITCAIKQFELRFTKLYHSAPNITGLDDERPFRSCSAFSVLKLPCRAQCNSVGGTKEFVIGPEKQFLIFGDIQPCMVSRNVPCNISATHEHINMLPVRSASQGNIYVLGSAHGKENVPVPTWSEVKSCRAHQVTPQAVFGGKKLSFTFHQDGGTDECSPLSRNCNRGFNALRVRRNEPSPPVALFEKADPLKKPMYDKVKVYCGAEEFSFEEIHAAIWFENQKKEQEQWHRSRHSVSKRLPFSHARSNLCCMADLACDVRNAQGKKLDSRCLKRMILNQNVYSSEDSFSLGNRLQASFEHSALRDTSHCRNSSNMESELQEEHNRHPPFTIYCSSEKEMQSSKKVLSDYDFANDSENVPPVGYVQTNVPRQRVGILQPIQGDLEENDLSVEETDMPFMKKGDTINTPVDTVQFVCSAVAASTPVKCDSSTNVDFDNFINGVVDAEYIEPNKNILYGCVNNSLIPHCSKTPLDFDTKANNEARCFSGSKISSTHSSKDLSIIFETTREHRSKSTSSAASSGKDSSSVSHLMSSNISSSKGSDFEAKISCVNNVANKEVVKQFDTKIEKNKTAAEPFDPETIKHLLSKIKHPIVSWKNFHGLAGSIKNIKSGKELYLRSGHYLITNFLAKEADVRVYAARFLRSFTKDGCNNPEVIIRVYESHNYWEFYICTELQKRLLKSAVGVSIMESITRCLCAVSYDDGTVLVMERCGSITLADLMNLFCEKRVPECLVMYFVFEMLFIVSQIHQCGILHRNIKPENFVVVKIPTYQEINDNIWARTQCLRLVNFRMGVDLRLFENDSTLCTVCKDLNFLQSGSWSFGVDYYGIANTIHNILFMEGIRIRTIHSHHELQSPDDKKWQKDLWLPLFEVLLNVPTGAEPPNVRPFMDLIAEKLQQQQHDLNFHLCHLSALYEKQLKKLIT